ncbi:copper resistance protein CopC [Kineosporia sp. A_224]|uniref:copper resistance CopC/CopD family protein n=1 Tax=Kineosporia sp. A_224 TaxID=1962180 RepID=UPI0013044172|nr:copper resistance protein CopC [Kineosporia sp. A_224]
MTGRAAPARPARRAVALLAAVVAALAWLVAGAPAASAHANLRLTEPVQGSRVETAPTAVTLRFSEGVGLSDRSVQVLDGNGRRVDTGPPSHPDGAGDVVTVRLQGGLSRGTYTVVYRVVSADSHPIAGTFSFGLGVQPGAVRADVAAASPDTVAVHGAARALSLAGAAGLVGGVVFCVAVWPAGTGSRRARSLVTASWWASLGTTLALFVVQGPYGAGLSLTSLLDPDLVGTTLSTRYGQLLLMRLVLLALAVPLLRRLDGDRTVVAPLAGLGGILLLTFSLAEHAGQGRLVPLAVAADAFHAGAASVWLGGLATLLLVVLVRPAPGDPRPDLSAVLPRWSRTAAGAVAVIVGTGLFQAWREVGERAALTGTTYGRLLLAKVALVVVMLVVAASARSLVTRLAGRGPDTAQTALRVRSRVATEAVVGVLVLAVTATLVGTVPARDSFDTPFSRTLKAVDVEGKEITVLLDLDSTRSGLTAMHVYTFTDFGDPLPFESATASLTQKAAGLGPVRVDLPVLTPGHGTTDAVVIPAAGAWSVSVRVLTDATTAYIATTTIDVRG